MGPVEISRRHVLRLLSLGLGSSLIAPRPAQAAYAVSYPDAVWKQRLSPEAYAVLRQEATEKPFTSPLYTEKRRGTYHCAGCDQALFRSQDKYDSGTGWPSFKQAIAGALGTKTDFKLILPRTEYHCSRCGGHQGHVFDDGPPPTGKRYCNNGVALRFQPAKSQG